MPIRVLLADDHPVVRRGLAALLGTLDDFEVVGEAEDGEAAVRETQLTKPDVVLMDVRMPRMDGIEATRRVVAELPETRVLALTTFDLDEYVYGAVRAGASGFLLKDVSPDNLVHAVHQVAKGDTILAPALTRRLLERFVAGPTPGALPPALEALSEREVEVLTLVAHGQSNAGIGSELFLSEATVKTYVSRLLAKLGLRDRVQLAVFAYECGLVTAGGQTSN